MALLLSLIMVFSVVGFAFAEDEPTSEPETSDAPTAVWAGSVDTAISISGLQPGDKVDFYRVLAYDQNAHAAVADATSVATGAVSWKAISPFDAMTLDDFKAILSTGITSGIAGRIAKLIGTSSPLYDDVTVAEDADTATQSSPLDGLYMAIITPAAGADYVYNPVFVGADYYTNTTNGWTVNTENSYSDNAMAKKVVITLDKTAKDAQTVDTNDEETVAVGDTITFTVTTVIPAYGAGANYTKPVFKISDKMSTGLDYTEGSVTVTVPTTLTKGTEYTVNESKDENDGNDFVLSFSETYLKSLTAPVNVTLTYTAEVTSEALSSVNPEDNTVTLNFSNSPDDQQGHGIKRDKTNHYSFDIDANLFGEENYEATEVVKVAVDKDGNEITETIQLSNEHWVGALAGAEFKLYKDNNGAKGAAYTNKYYTADSVFVSDEHGTLKLKGSDIQGIRGLDAGKYWLEEINAPEGYIKLQEAVAIEIVATTQEVEYTEEVDGVEVTYKADELVSYTVSIGEKQTANYEMVNDTESGAHPHIKATKGDTVVGGNDSTNGHPSENKDGKLQNTRGYELPATGGIGTTIFYVAGIVLVLGAAAIIVARRKAEQN